MVLPMRTVGSYLQRWASRCNSYSILCRINNNDADRVMQRRQIAGNRFAQIKSETQNDAAGEIENKGWAQVSHERQRQRRNPCGAEQQTLDPFMHDAFQAIAAAGRRAMAFSLIGKLISAANTPSAIVIPHTVL